MAVLASGTSNRLARTTARTRERQGLLAGCAPCDRAVLSRRSERTGRPRWIDALGVARGGVPLRVEDGVHFDVRGTPLVWEALLPDVLDAAQESVGTTSVG